MRKTLENVLLEGEGNRLIVRDGKQKYFNDTMKSFPVNQLIGKTAIIVKVVNNLIMEIRLENGDVFPSRTSRVETSITTQSQPDNDMAIDRGRKPARAPYNFVPLNEIIISGNGITDHSTNDYLSGYITIKLVAWTPLYVMGHDKNFFRIKDKHYIPGSSIRGMVHNLMEITAYGQLGADDQFDDRQLYRRSNLADDGNDILAGFLVIVDGRFKIRAAISSQIRQSNIHYPHFYDFRNDENTCTFSTGKFGNRLTVWKFKKLSDSISIDIDQEVIDGYNSDDTRSEVAIDIILSLKKGKIVNKTCNSIKANDREVIIPSELGIPVFYRVDTATKKVISIGHAKYHRIPYEHSVGDHIDQKSESNLPDFASIIFGTTGLAGKVYFEDIEPIGGIREELTESKRPKILSSPKPTTYQHYLVRPNGVNTNQMALKKWSDKDAKIRGYKQYWHRNTSSNIDDPDTWIEKGKITKSHPNPINPISKDSEFHGRIRFDNLTNQELGALLFVLELRDGCCHKLGMGKPLGLGAVRITPQLTIIDRRPRYETLFDNIGDTYYWHSAERKMVDTDTYKNAFAKYIGEKTGQSAITSADDYWTQDKRMLELEHMLTFAHVTKPISWQDRTRYMQIEHPTKDPQNEYKNEPVLPRPSQVVQDNAYDES